MSRKQMTRREYRRKMRQQRRMGVRALIYAVLSVPIALSSPDMLGCFVVTFVLVGLGLGCLLSHDIVIN